MNKSPLVSVLMPVYNDEKNISAAIQSILQQSYQHFEIIVVNDGSTDGTASVLEHFQKVDDRIKIINQRNMGLADTLNNGIKHCKGKYIARLDSDDISYPFRLKEQVEFLEEHPEIGLVGGGCHIADDTGRIIGVRNIFSKKPQKILMHRCIFQHSDVMYRRDVVLSLPGGVIYRNKFKAEDYDLWLRISEVTGIAKMNRIFGVWTLNAGGYTLSRKQEQLEAAKIVRKMAIARRKGLGDWYDSFTPKAIEKGHRLAVQDFEYDLTIAKILLKERRVLEVRKQLEKYKYNQVHWKAVRIWFYLSYLPKPVLKILFDFREYLLNNTSIELR